MAPGIDNVKLFVILRMKHAAALYPFAITWISYQHSLDTANTNSMFMPKNRRVGMSPCNFSISVAIKISCHFGNMPI